MNIQEYNNFVKSMKVYPEKHAITYPALGLAGEAGEIAEKVKKWLRGDNIKYIPDHEQTVQTYMMVSDEFREAILQELGDPLWYIVSLADDLGYSLQDVIDRNVEKLTSRKDRGVVKGSGDNR